MRLRFPLLLATFFVAASNLRAADLSPRVSVQIRNATYHNMLRYAPEPQLPRAALVQCQSGTGVFVVEINYASGIPDSVRMVKTTGCPVIDQAVLATLYQWRFMPHAIWKAIFPVSFDARARRIR